MGKTKVKYDRAFRVKKHPHGRGEDTKNSQLTLKNAETPPRAWGRLSHCFVKMQTVRNTPTGVGKTYQAVAYEGTFKKHPHGRGEDGA